MSTPPKTAFDPNDLFAVPGQAPAPDRRRADAESWPADAVVDDPLRSPYAPKAGRVRPVAEADPLRSPYAPKGGRVRPVAKADDLHEQSVTGQYEVDLDRLENSLRWLQRQDAETRLRPQVQPAPALARRSSTFSASERLDLRSGQPHELDWSLSPPPAVDRSNLKWPLTLIAILIAAPILYYLSQEGWSLASDRPRLVALKDRFGILWPSSEEEASPIRSREDRSTAFAPAPSLEPSESVPTEPTSSDHVVSLPERDVIDAVSRPPTPPVKRVLDSEEIALLVKQGEQFVATGDLAVARTVFRRAAEAGDASAAVAMGATYDPEVLKKLGVIGMESNLEKARSWYKTAERLGSAEATRRLRILASH